MSGTPSAAPLSWARRIGWASGDAGINFYWQGVGIFAYFFYTDVMGISPMWAGIAFAAASFWDAIIDPIIGAIADRTRTRFGRFRPWILFASVPCAVSFALMFWTPPLVGGWLIAYAIATHIFLRTMLAAIGIPFSALTARMTHDSNERGTIAMLRLMFAATGALAVAFTVPKLVEVLGDEKRAYFYAACILAAGATIILFISFLSTRELPADDEDTLVVDERRGIWRTFVADLIGFWSTLRHNGPLARLFAAVILSGITTAMNGKVLLYWIKYDLKDPSVMTWLLPLPAVWLVLIAPGWTWVARRWSKRSAWMLGTSLSIVSLLSFYIVNPHDHVTLVIITLIGATGGSAGLIMFWSMLPDTVEYNQWVRGDRSEAKIFGFAAFGQKAAYGINALLLGQLLTAIGFVADQPQSPEILLDLRGIMCLIPLAGVIGTIIIMWRYPITADFHARLRTDLAARAKPNAIAAIA